MKSPFMPAAIWNIFLFALLAVIVKGEHSLRFVQEPVSQVVPEHGSLTLNCDVVPSSAVVRWFHNGQQVNNGDQGTSINGSSLVIRDFRVDDTTSDEGAHYYCIADSSLGSIISQTAKLELARFETSSVSSNFTVSVIEGGTASLPCIFVNSTPAAQITFEKVDEESGEFQSARFSIVPSHQLQISQVQVEDAGFYRCVTINPLTGQNYTAEQLVHLQVIPTELAQTGPPRIFGSSEQTIVKVQNGERIILECAASAKPTPIITWKKYGGQLPANRVRKVLGKMIITGAHHRDEGTYICWANNGIGKRAQKVFQVDVLEPPRVRTDNKHLVVQKGDNARLTCFINGQPQPLIEWYHNAVLIKTGSDYRIRDGSLKIKNVDVHHAGFYQCMAQNKLGSSQAIIHLEVSSSELKSTDEENDLDRARTQPKRRKNGKRNKKGRRRQGKNGKHRQKNSNMVPPSKPEISKLTDSSVMVRWSVPQNNGLPITFFLVQYKEVKPKKGKWNTQDEQIRATVREFKVHGLTPGITYRFRIAAVYSNKDNLMGPNSDRFTLHNDGGNILKSPVKGPIIVEVEPLTHENIYALVIQWRYIPVESTPIDGFTIFYKAYNSQESYSPITLRSRDVRKYIIMNLKPGTAYSVKIQSFNDAGCSEFSNVAVKTTLQEDPSDGKVNSSPSSKIGVSFWPPVRSTAATITAEPSDAHHGSRTSTQASSELLYMILGIILGLMLLLLVIFMVMCWLKQRQQRRMMAAMGNHYPDVRRKYMNGGFALNGINGTIMNGHVPHTQHPPHKMNISVNPVGDLDRYVPIMDRSQPQQQQHGDVAGDVRENMLNHLQHSDSNCNSIDQSKSPQTMQVKNPGSSRSINSRSPPPVESMNSTDSDHAASRAHSSDGLPLYGSYERVPNNSHPRESFELVSNEQPLCDTFLLPDSSHCTHNMKHKKKRRKPYVQEQTKRDQATNTDLSSNEGTLEFSPLKPPSEDYNQEHSSQTTGTHTLENSETTVSNAC